MTLGKPRKDAEPLAGAALSRRQLLAGAGAAGAGMLLPSTGQAQTGLAFSPIYAVRQNGDMLYYRHNGVTTGAARWPVTAARIGWGWNFRHVFAGQAGAIYAIRQNGDMFFYRHAGYATGAVDWPIHAVKIGWGWDFPQVFAGARGAIYAVTYDGKMLYYKHDGWQTGAADWPIQARVTNLHPAGGIVAVAGRGGAIYLVWPDGLLTLARQWGPDPTKFVYYGVVGNFGNVWRQYRHVFAGSAGSIYGIDQAGDMMHYHHTGNTANDHREFHNSWSPDTRHIGNGWHFRQVFASF